MTRSGMKFFVLVLASSAFVSTALWWPGRSGNDYASLHMTPHQEGHNTFMYLIQASKPSVDSGKPSVESGTQITPGRETQANKEKHTDRYSEPSQGEATAGEWCKNGNSDTVCEVDPEIEILRAEMDNIVNFMMCRRSPTAIQCLCATDPGNPVCIARDLSYETIDFQRHGVENEASVHKDVGVAAEKKHIAEQAGKQVEEKRSEAATAAKEVVAAEKTAEEAEVAAKEATEKTARVKAAAEAANEAADSAKEKADAEAKAAAEAEAEAEAAARNAAEEAGEAEKTEAKKIAEEAKKKSDEADAKASAAKKAADKQLEVVKQAKNDTEAAVRAESNATEAVQTAGVKVNATKKEATKAKAEAEAAEKVAEAATAAADRAEKNADMAKAASEAPPVPKTGCTVEIFKKRVALKIGHSDFVFLRHDEDHNGKISEGEFQRLVIASGCLGTDAPKLYRNVSVGGEPIPEDTLGATKPEIVRRIKAKYGSPTEAMQAGDTDGDGSMSKWEVYEQCMLVANAESCKKFQDSMPDNMSREYYNWKVLGIPDFKNDLGNTIRLSKEGKQDESYRRNNVDEDSTGTVRKRSMPNGIPTYEIAWSNGATMSVPEKHVEVAFKFEVNNVVRLSAEGRREPLEKVYQASKLSSESTATVRQRSVTNGLPTYRVAWDTQVALWVPEEDLELAFKFSVEDVLRLSEKGMDVPFYQATGVTADSTGPVLERFLDNGVPTYRVKWDNDKAGNLSLPESDLQWAFKFPVGSRVQLSVEGKKHPPAIVGANVDIRGSVEHRDMVKGIPTYEVKWDNEAAGIVPEIDLDWEFGIPPSVIVEEETPEEAAEKLKQLVNNLKNFKASAEAKGKMDSELGEHMDDIIQSGTETADALEKLDKLTPQEQEQYLNTVQDKVNALDDSIFGFETGIHPHGYKWWRFRWEYAFVEALVATLLVFTTAVLYKAFAACALSMNKFSRVSEEDYDGTNSILVMFHILWQRIGQEFNIFACITIFIWVSEECGLFWLLMEWAPISRLMNGNGTDTVMYLPITDTHWVNTLRAVNVHLFFAMMLYYLLMYFLVYGAFWTLMIFVRHESPEVYEEFVSRPVEQMDIYTQLPQAAKSKAFATKLMMTDRCLLARVLNSDRLTGMIIGCMDKTEDYTNLREYFVSHAQNYKGFHTPRPDGVTLHSMIKVMPLYPYFAMCLQQNLQTAIVMRWQTWVMIEIVLVIQTLLHYFLHLAVMEILPFSIAIGVICVVIQYIWVRRGAAYIVNPDNRAEVEQESRRRTAVAELKQQDVSEDFIDWLEQLNLFFLCFSCARLLSSYFFWHDYPHLGVVAAVCFFLSLLAFLFIGTLSMNFFTILHSVPPYVSKADLNNLERLAEHQFAKSGLEESQNYLEKSDSVRASSRYLIP